MSTVYNETKCMELEDYMALPSKLTQQTAAFALGVWKGFSTMASETKSPKLVKKIGTHSGIFHCDEALACFMLKQLPDYSDCEIIRTRDDNVLDTCDIVVDVGGVYNPKINRFDHHQRDFAHTLSTVRPDLVKNKAIKLSSAGLIYAHYGLEVISAILKRAKLTATSECLRSIYCRVYDGFVEELDAIDNGIPICADANQKYRINTHLSARVNRLNPQWNSREHEPVGNLFLKAVELVGGEFTETVLNTVTVWWPARELVKTALENRKKVHESGQLFALPSSCPWKEHLMELEDELGIAGELKFCIFPDNGSAWRVQGIPVQPDSFICRVFLHKDWRGVRDEKLSAVSGIKGCVFCHATGFIGGNETREGAVEMALKSLNAALADRE